MGFHSFFELVFGETAAQSRITDTACVLVRRDIRRLEYLDIAAIPVGVSVIPLLFSCAYVQTRQDATAMCIVRALL